VRKSEQIPYVQRLLSNWGNEEYTNKPINGYGQLKKMVAVVNIIKN
jgi:hypothetical protein